MKDKPGDQEFAGPFCHVKASSMTLSMNQERRPSSGINLLLVLVLASRTRETNFYCIYIAQCKVFCYNNPDELQHSRPEISDSGRQIASSIQNSGTALGIRAIHHLVDL